jgi:hypothetical protein
MSLEQLYNGASRNTYVGTVRERQEQMVGVNGPPLVNFLDGDIRGSEATPDQFQREFTRNESGAYKSGGSQGITRTVGATLSRWTSKAYELAFGGKGPSTLPSGYYNNKFTNNKTIHLYTPNRDGGFVNKNTSASNRKNGSPSGAPTGF